MAFSTRSYDYSSQKLIPCVVMDGPPNEKTYGGIGVLCMDRKSGSLYKCVSENFQDNLFTWQIVGEVSDDLIQQSVSNFFAKNPVIRGLTNEEKNMILTLFRGAAYQDESTSEVADAYDQLATLWGIESDDDSGSGDSAGDSGDTGSEDSGETNVTVIPLDGRSFATLSGTTTKVLVAVEAGCYCAAFYATPNTNYKIVEHGTHDRFRFYGRTTVDDSSTMATVNLPMDGTIADHSTNGEIDSLYEITINSGGYQTIYVYLATKADYSPDITVTEVE